VNLGGYMRSCWAAACARPVLTAAAIIVVVGGIVRLGLLVGVPLMVTNDGVFYAHWAWNLATGQDVGQLPSYRTPGYPFALAGVFALCGRDPLPIVVAQRFMGLLAAVTVAMVATRITTRRTSASMAILIGVACGLVPALDPRLLAMESYLLSESLSVLLVVLVLVLPMAIARFSVWHMLWIGVLAGLLCLVRPVFQVAAPLVLIGVALAPGSARLRTRLLALALGGLMFAATVSPWLWFNHKRGVSGFGEGGAAVLWLGLGMSGRLDASLAPSEQLADEYARIVGDDPNSSSLHRFVFSIGTFEQPDVREDIGLWAIRTVLEHPGSYLRGVLIATLWQCDYLPGGTRPPERELIWMVRRVSVGGGEPGPASNMIIGGAPGPALQPLAMDRPSSGMAWIFNAWGYSHHFGFVTLLLLASAVSAGALCLVRRRWMLAFMIAGGGAAFAVHVALLSPYARYSLPIWMAWAVTPAVLVAYGTRLERSIDHRIGHQSQDAS